MIMTLILMGMIRMIFFEDGSAYDDDDLMMKATNVTIRLSKRRDGAARRQDGENSRRWKISACVLASVVKWLLFGWHVIFKSR